MSGRARTFDYAYAERLRSEGLTQTAIAEIIGVSQFAISYALSAEVRERAKRYREERKPWLGVCIDCGGPATHTRWQNAEYVRQGRCSACRGLAVAESVRADSLRCSRCREWKPDTAFPRGRVRARRFRAAECTPCGTERRREARKAGRP